MNKNSPTIIYLVRHGESTHNAGLYKGEKEHEIVLTQKGKKQAKEIAEKLKNINFDLVFSSDYLRAKQTAEIIVSERHLKVNINTLIRERIFGENYYNNREKIRQEIKEIFRKLTDEEKLNYKHTKDMESAKEGAERLRTFLKEIAFTHSGKIILVVCHGNIMRSLLNLLEWCRFEEIPEKSIENTGYIKIEVRDTRFNITETYKVNKVNKSERIL